MVFKMFSTGSHTKKLNGKLIKHDKYKLRVNPFNENKVYLNTTQKKGKKYYNYENIFNNQKDFMKKFINKKNQRSLFKMNERSRQQTKKYKKKLQKKNDKNKN